MKEYLLVGTYTTDYVHGCGKGMYCYAYDSNTGEIGEMTDVVEMENPSYLTVNLQENLLFAVSETMDVGKVYSCSIEAGKITRKDCLSVNGVAACHVAYSEKARLLAISNYMSGSLEIVSVQARQKLEQRFQIKYHGKGVIPERQEMSHVHSCIFYKNYLLVADLGLDQIHVYKTVNNEIEFLTDIQLKAGSGPRHMAVYQKGNNAWLYIVNELSCDISVYQFQEGTFQEIQRKSLCEGRLNENSLAADIHITKEGILYASLRGEDKIIWYKICSGSLTKLGSIGSGGKGPRSFCFDKRERHLIVANQHSDNLVVYSLEDGILREEKHMFFSVSTPVKVLTVSE